MHRNQEHGRHRRGPSSYWMNDPQIIFDSLGLRAGDWFLDLGCGPGDYSIQAAKIVGRDGCVYAFDKSHQMIGLLKDEAGEQGLPNLKAIVVDITGALPLEDNRIDVCLLATVFHIPAVSRHAGILFQEILRVLKRGGHLAIIECKKEDMPFGPPKEMRWSPEEMENAIGQAGFKRIQLIELTYNYMIQFRAVKK